MKSSVSGLIWLHDLIKPTGMLRFGPGSFRFVNVLLFALRQNSQSLHNNALEQQSNIEPGCIHGPPALRALSLHMTDADPPKTPLFLQKHMLNINTRTQAFSELRFSK